MVWEKNNIYWKLRTKDGKDKIYKTPTELWGECVLYFQWVEENPLYEEKVFHSAGIITRADTAKLRAMTISGLCLFLGICEKTWANYRNRDDYLQVITRAERIIRTQKFEGAAADLLNPNIIARDLGLIEKKDVTTTHEVSQETAKEIAELTKKFLSTDE